MSGYGTIFGMTVGSNGNIYVSSNAHGGIDSQGVQRIIAGVYQFDNNGSPLGLFGNEITYGTGEGTGIAQRRTARFTR